MKMVEWLQKHWFLIVALSSMSAAWGQAQYKIQSLEEAVKSNAEVKKEIVQIRSQSDRVDERTQSIQASQARQERLIEMLLDRMDRRPPTHAATTTPTLR
jgi:urocanate hydratase